MGACRDAPDIREEVKGGEIGQVGAEEGDQRGECDGVVGTKEGGGPVVGSGMGETRE